METSVPYNKEVRFLLELLAQNSTPLGRNDPCLCDSGKKYKNCCLKKESSSSNTREEIMEITTDPLTPEEAQHDFPKLEEADEKLKSSLFDIYHKHPEQIDSEDCEYIQKLHALQKKYPNNPMILNFLSTGYQRLKMDDRAKELLLLAYEKCPNYLFSKTGRAHLYILEDEPQKALDVLGGFTLKQVYPNRSVFHITEVKAFAFALLQCFCKLENIRQAEAQLNILQDILNEEDPILQTSEEIFWEAKREYNIKVGLAKLERFHKKRK